jgi:hypothetical protein
MVRLLSAARRDFERQMEISKGTARELTKGLLRAHSCHRLHAAGTEATEAQAAALGQVDRLYAFVRFREKLPSSFRR